VALPDTAIETTQLFPIADACTQIYSPTVLADAVDATLFHMWFGGWTTCADRDQYGNDRIYHSTSRDLRSWTPPTAVITSPSHHFNDPSVVHVTVSGTPVYVMYMTGCTTAADCFTTGHNITYGATSYDGLTWSAPQQVIGIANGINNGGAWSPCALEISDNLVYLYYFVNTGSDATEGQVQRATIDPQADLFAATDPTIIAAPYHVNVDVRVTAAGYEMLYDSGTPFRIHRLVSTTGLDFQPDPTFPGIDGSPSYRANTGHAFTVPGTDHQYWLYFGWAEAPVDKPITIMGWRWERH
jgi:hypothetical protein